MHAIKPSPATKNQGYSKYFTFSARANRFRNPEYPAKGYVPGYASHTDSFFPAQQGFVSFPLRAAYLNGQEFPVDFTTRYRGHAAMLELLFVLDRVFRTGMQKSTDKLCESRAIVRIAAWCIMVVCSTWQIRQKIVDCLNTHHSLETEVSFFTIVTGAL